jgi:hypothetical protein
MFMPASPEVECSPRATFLGQRAGSLTLTRIARDRLCTANYSRLARIEMLIRM